MNRSNYYSVSLKHYEDDISEYIPYVFLEIGIFLKIYIAKTLLWLPFDSRDILDYKKRLLKILMVDHKEQGSIEFRIKYQLLIDTDWAIS